MVCSIGLGALVVSIFEPMFLVISALCILALAWMVAKGRAEGRWLIRTKDQLQLEQNQHTETNRALRSMIDSADIPILATDASGQIVTINPEGLRVLGIDDQVIGRVFEEIMPQRLLQELEEDARRDEPGHARCSLPIAGEMRSFDVSADLIPATGGAVLIFRDITELSGAMTLKTDFVANASHELRTPIASIKGAAETLTGPAKDDEPMRDRLVEMIASNANRLEMLATDLLDLSRLESEHQPPNIVGVRLGEVIGPILADLEPMADRRGLTIQSEIGEGIEHINTDPSLISLMIRNLVGNAIKFAHEHTTIRVKFHTQPIAIDRTIPVPTGLEGEMGLVIEVIDRGVGIPISQQQRVFERFYQVDEARSGSGVRRGTGLGLAIVKHAARRLGGTVTLESVHQEGTTVRIFLPRCID